MYQRALPKIPARIAAWNRAAENIGHPEYCVETYEKRPIEFYPYFFDAKSCGAFLTLQLKCGFSVTNITWEETVDTAPNIGCKVTGHISIPTEKESLETYGAIHYLMLAAFTSHESSDFVERFYADEGWTQNIHQLAGYHNGYSYQKTGMYNGYLTKGCTYTEFFKDLPINQELFGGDPPERQYWGSVEIEKGHTSYWQDQYAEYTDYS
ncbi:MAG: hypothetical protein IKT68_00555 [Clostridia bacterium]|nr:hypothetical protein [Clostridia bacterium]